MALRTSGDKKGHENPLLPNNSDSPKQASGSATASELYDAENNPQQGKQGAIGALEEGLVKGGLSALGGPASSGYNIISSFFGRKKKTVGAIAIGLVLGFSGIVGFGIIQGPMQLMHLAQILSLPLSDQEDASQKRLGGLLRFMRTGDIGETRVSYLGSRSAKKTFAKLENEAGLKVVDRTRGSGRPSVIEIDTSKYAPSLTTAEAAAAYADAHNIPPDQIRMDVSVADQKGGKFRVGDPDRALSDSIARSMFRDAIGKMYGKLIGPIMTAVKARPVFAKNGNFSKLRIWKRLNTWAMDKAAEADQARKARKGEKSPKANERLARLKGKIRPAAGVAAAVGAVQLGGCIAMDVAKDAPLATYENVVMPSENHALEFLVADSQLRAGDDFLITQPGAMAKNLSNKDGNAWQSKALNAMAYRDGGSGEDAPEEFKNSFRPESPVLEIEKELNRYGGKFMCSTAGQIIGGVIGISALVLAAPSGGLSLGIYAAGAAGSALAVAGGAYYLTKALTSVLAEESIYNDPQGKDLGHTLAFGSQALAADLYRKSGGAAIPGQNATSVPLSAQREDEFQQRSFFARVFDIYDYRSLASKIIDKSNLSSTQMVANLVNSFGILGSIFPNMINAFSPSLFAADGSGAYDFGFPRYGFSEEDLNNPLMEDPYENAEKAVDILKSDDNYIDRARDCFGVEFDKSNGWKVDLVDNPDGDPEKDVVPSTAKYHEANCGDKSDEWLIVRLFIFDSRTMEAYSCYENIDEDSCIQPEGGVSGDSGSSGEVNEGVEIGDGFTIQKYDPPLASPGGKIEPKGIILHWWGSDSGGEGIDFLADALRGNNTCGEGGCSVQFGITNNGEIYQMTENEDDLTYHVAGSNSTTFGIEMEGGPDQFGRQGKQKYPEKFKAAVALVKYLVEKYNIKINGSSSCGNVSGVHSHKDIQPCNRGKTDVDNFYRDEIIKAVQGG